MKTKIFFSLALLCAACFPLMAQKADRSKTDPVEIGTTAPDFTLADENGKSVTLSKLKQPTVLVFYRGYW